MLDVSDTTRGFLPPRMTTTQMNNVVSPANGLMVYNTDSAGYFYHDGVNWLSITSLSPTSSTVDNVGEAGVVIIKDLKSSGVTGGPSLDKTWEERDLNTIEGDNSFITLSSNQFTLNAGVYLINWSSPGYGVNYFVTRLYNVTESRTESEGEALFSTVTGINRTSSGKTIIEIPSQKVFSIQQYSSLNSSSGLGADVNVGINELYTQVEIIKLDKVFGSGANALGGSSTQGIDSVLAVGNDADGNELNNLGQVGVGTSTVDGSAMLDVSSTSQGFLAPRMTHVQMNNISDPAEGLVVYNTDSARYFYHNGSSWQSVRIENVVVDLITDGDDNTQVSVEDETNVIFTAGGFERARISSAGNIGIGTNNPQELLDVAGTATVNNLNINDAYDFPDSDGSSGQVLQTNGSGTVTWQSASGGTSDVIEDANENTKIQVEESVDDDVIRFDNDTRETFTFTRGRIEVLDAGRTIAIGEGAGAADDFSLNDNTLIGFEAGNRLTTGFRNVSIGNYSLTQAISSNNSIAIGFEALKNSTGFRNVAIGSNALEGALTTADNVAVGYQAALSNSANRNTAIGARALSSNTSGSNNVAIGVDAGNANGGGSNIFLGYQAGQNELGNHKLYIENSNSSTPLIWGDFTNDSLKVYGTLSVGDEFTFPAADGTNGQVLQTNGSGNVSWGSISGADNLGDHTATTNINLNGNYLSGDGTAEGIHVDADGDVTIGSDKGFRDFAVWGESGSGGVDVSFFSEDAFPEIAFGAYGSGSSSGTVLQFSKSRGAWLSSSPVADGDNVVKFNTSLRFSTSSIIDNFFRLDIDGTPVGSTVPTSLKFYTVNPAGFYNPLVMLSSGNVGIGLSSPSARLEVDGRAIVDTLEIDGEYSLPADDGINGQVLQTDGSGNVSWAAVSGGGGGASDLIQDADGDTRIESETGTDNDELSFFTNGNEVAKIASDGSFLIGDPTVTTPSGQIHLVTSNHISGGFFNNESSGLAYGVVGGSVIGNNTRNIGLAGQAGGSGTSEAIGVYGVASGADKNYSAYFENGLLYSEDSVAVGTKIPNALFHVEGTSQLNQLSIGGNYTFPTTDGTNGQVLQTDGSGNVSWAAVSGGGGASDAIEDADGDTKIQVEESANEDVIRFDVAGFEIMKLDGVRLHMNDGLNSVYIGTVTSNNLTTGFANIGVGHNTLSGTSTGNGNTAVGFSAMSNNTTGRENVAIGRTAMPNNTTANYNVAVGTSAMHQSQTGGSNTAVGWRAAYTGNGASNNTSIGNSALYDNVIGSNNVSVGNSSLRGTLGSNNVGLGSEAGFSSSGSGNIYIGYQAGFNESTDNKLYIENSNSPTPLIWGDFANDSLKVYGTLSIGDEFTFPATDGTNGQVLQTDGSGNVSWAAVSGGGGASDAIEDADGDTKIQVEEISDDDIIRFDISGTQYFVMSQGTLSFDNVGRSIFIGTGAGTNDDLTDNENVFLGWYSGLSNTTGNSNTFIGAKSGTSATSASDNTFVGHESGDAVTTGFYNTLIGSRTGFSLIDGGSNTVLGRSAMSFNQSGSNNVAIGNRAYREGTASNNIAVGYNAMEGASTGEYNIAIGIESMAGSPFTNKVTGDHNVSMGYQAGEVIGAGSNNVFIGTASGSGNQGGNNNVALGYEAGLSSDGDNSVFLGYQAGKLSSGSNILYIENSDSNNPLIYGDFSSDSLSINGKLNVTTGMNVASGSVGIGTTSPTQKLHVVGQTYSTSIQADQIGVNRAPSASHDFALQSSRPLMMQIETTNSSTFAKGMVIRLGAFTPTTTTSFLEFRSGAGTAIGSITGNGSGGVQYNTSSDRRLKQNIRPLSNSLDLIGKIEPKVYERKLVPGVNEHGFIAQELQLVYPQIVAGDSTNSVEESPMSVDYSKLTPLLTAGVKDLHELVKVQSQTIKNLKATAKKQDLENQKLKARLERLEAIMLEENAE